MNMVIKIKLRGSDRDAWNTELAPFPSFHARQWKGPGDDLISETGYEMINAITDERNPVHGRVVSTTTALSPNGHRRLKTASGTAPG